MFSLTWFDQYLHEVGNCWKPVFTYRNWGYREVEQFVWDHSINYRAKCKLSLTHLNNILFLITFLDIEREIFKTTLIQEKFKVMLYPQLMYGHLTLTTDHLNICFR